MTQNFAGGSISAPVAGIISTDLAHAGQSLVAGTAIAEILDPADAFVAWYIPNERLGDPTVGQEVAVLFGNRRIRGTVAGILPVSAVYAAAEPVLARERRATQIARIRFEQGAEPPPLNSSVTVHMYYTRAAALAAGGLASLFGLY